MMEERRKRKDWGEKTKKGERTEERKEKVGKVIGEEQHGGKKKGGNERRRG